MHPLLFSVGIITPLFFLLNCLSVLFYNLSFALNVYFLYLYVHSLLCQTCKKAFSSGEEFLDLTIISNTKVYGELKPLSTELFRQELLFFSIVFRHCSCIRTCGLNTYCGAGLLLCHFFTRGVGGKVFFGVASLVQRKRCKHIYFLVFFLLPYGFLLFLKKEKNLG